jgi:hypothetical protein
MMKADDTPARKLDKHEESPTWTSILALISKHPCGVVNSKSASIIIYVDPTIKFTLLEVVRAGAYFGVFGALVPAMMNGPCDAATALSVTKQIVDPAFSPETEAKIVEARERYQYEGGFTNGEFTYIANATRATLFSDKHAVDLWSAAR